MNTCYIVGEEFCKFELSEWTNTNVQVSGKHTDMWTIFTSMCTDRMHKILGNVKWDFKVTEHCLL